MTNLLGRRARATITSPNPKWREDSKWRPVGNETWWIRRETEVEIVAFLGVGEYHHATFVVLDEDGRLHEIGHEGLVLTPPQREHPYR